MPERRKRPRDPSDVPQIFQRGRGCSVYRIFNSWREGVMHRLVYDERAAWCINKCNKNRSKSLISVKDQGGTLRFKPVVFLSAVFVLFLFFRIWRGTDTESTFYLYLKARRRNKPRANTDSTWNRNDSSWNRMERSTDSLHIREHSIQINLSKRFHLKLWDSQPLPYTGGMSVSSGFGRKCLAAAGRALRRTTCVQIFDLTNSSTSAVTSAPADMKYPLRRCCVYNTPIS